jgi:hypothetical protein
MIIVRWHDDHGRSEGFFCIVVQKASVYPEMDRRRKLTHVQPGWLECYWFSVAFRSVSSCTNLWLICKTARLPLLVLMFSSGGKERGWGSVPQNKTIFSHFHPSSTHKWFSLLLLLLLVGGQLPPPTVEEIP